MQEIPEASAVVQDEIDGNEKCCGQDVLTMAHLAAILRGERIKQLREMLSAPLQKKYGVNRMELMVLNFLGHVKMDTISEMRRYLSVNKGYLSKMMAKLMQKGLVTSHGDAKDRRVVHYQLTAKGAEAANEVYAQMVKTMHFIISGIPEDKLMQLYACSVVIDRNIEQLMAHGDELKEGIIPDPEKDEGLFDRLMERSEGVN